MYKKIYSPNELPDGIYDYLISIKDKLYIEFLTAWPEYSSKGALPNDYDDLLSCKIPSKATYTEHTTSSPWKVTGPRNAFNDLVDMYPTANSVANHFGSDNVNVTSFSIIEPKSIIYRHRDPDNFTGEFVRIHIPIYIPDSTLDLLGMEVGGEEVQWDDIVIFSNNEPHSVWNHTDERRIVFIVDISRKYLGWDMPPPGIKYDHSQHPRTYRRDGKRPSDFSVTQPIRNPHDS